MVIHPGCLIWSGGDSWRTYQTWALVLPSTAWRVPTFASFTSTISSWQIDTRSMTVPIPPLISRTGHPARPSTRPNCTAPPVDSSAHIDGWPTPWSTGAPSRLASISAPAPRGSSGSSESLGGGRAPAQAARTINDGIKNTWRIRVSSPEPTATPVIP